MSSIMAKLKKNSKVKSTEILSKSKFFNDKDMIPSDVPMINVALSGDLEGGLTPGLTVLAGPSKHFKTSFALKIASAYLKKYEDAGEFDKVKEFYNGNDFFKTLIGNCMMSLSKSFFELTQYMEKDKEFGEFWKVIHEEYLTTKRLILKLTDYTELMQSNKVGKASINIREDIVLPLITIQQFALIKIQKLQKDENADPELVKIFEKMVTRSLFGNINASRNSA